MASGENTEIEVVDGFIRRSKHTRRRAHIYAIGDIIGGLQLAHVASHEELRL